MVGVLLTDNDDDDDDILIHGYYYSFTCRARREGLPGLPVHAHIR